MATSHATDAGLGSNLDVQALQGLETYISTEKFLHTLEQVSAEWIDLSDHKQHPQKGWSPASDAPELQLSEMPSSSQQAAADTPPQQPLVNSQAKGSGGSFLFRWRRPSQVSTSASSSGAEDAAGNLPPADSADTVATSNNVSNSDDALPAVVAAITTFELVEPQAPLVDPTLQEPFVLVSADDAIEGMAYYIALYLSRAPEARYMEPKQLQAALRQTMVAIRRSRYRVIWDWSRCLYRWGAVSYSALQLYEHPWLVRAVVTGIWASSKMAFGILL